LNPQTIAWIRHKRVRVLGVRAPGCEVPGTNAKGLGKALPMAMDIDQIMVGPAR